MITWLSSRNCVFVRSMPSTQLLHQLLAAEQREGGREDRRADEQPAHHRGGLGGEEHRLLHDAEVELPVGRRQQEAAQGADGRRLGGRGQAEHDGPEHGQDQQQQREEAGQQHLEHFEPREAEQRVEDDDRQRRDGQADPVGRRRPARARRRQLRAAAGDARGAAARRPVPTPWRPRRPAARRRRRRLQPAAPRGRRRCRSAAPRARRCPRSAAPAGRRRRSRRCRCRPSAPICCSSLDVLRRRRSRGEVGSSTARPPRRASPGSKRDEELPQQVAGGHALRCAGPSARRPAPAPRAGRPWRRSLHQRLGQRHATLLGRQRRRQRRLDLGDDDHVDDVQRRPA